jgi:hypothetical protein
MSDLQDHTSTHSSRRCINIKWPPLSSTTLHRAQPHIPRHSISLPSSYDALPLACCHWNEGPLSLCIYINWRPSERTPLHRAQLHIPRHSTSLICIAHRYLHVATRMKLPCPWPRSPMEAALGACNAGDVVAEGTPGIKGAAGDSHIWLVIVAVRALVGPATRICCHIGYYATYAQTKQEMGALSTTRSSPLRLVRAVKSPAEMP